MACSNILSVPLREMTEETGLAAKDGEVKKYVSAEGVASSGFSHLG